MQKISNRIITAFVTSLSFLFFLQPVSAAGQNLFPSDTVFSGWEIVKDSTFTGDALYGHIDGGAELFFEFGFVKVDVRIVKPNNSEDEITIEIYQMADPDAALGLFLIKSANLFPDKRLPIPNLVNNYQVSYIKGNYCILISSASGTEPLKEKMLQFGESIAVKLQDKARSGFDTLPAAGRIPGSERLLRGPLALQTIYPLGENPMLWHGIKKGERLNAFAADYKTVTSDIYSFILCDYPDDKASSGAMGAVRAGHDPYLEKIINEENRLIFKDWNGFFTIVIRDKSRIEIYARLKEPKISHETN
jgi:hypothetical protein